MAHLSQWTAPVNAQRGRISSQETLVVVAMVIATAAGFVNTLSDLLNPALYSVFGEGFATVWRQVSGILYLVGGVLLGYFAATAAQRKSR
jgi:hypothetical protein